MTRLDPGAAQYRDQFHLLRGKLVLHKEAQVAPAHGRITKHTG